MRRGCDWAGGGFLWLPGATALPPGVAPVLGDKGCALVAHLPQAVPGVVDVLVLLAVVGQVAGRVVGERVVVRAVVVGVADILCCRCRGTKGSPVPPPSGSARARGCAVE